MEKVRIGKYNFEGEEWTQVSSEAKVLISKMVHKDPKKRYSAEQALQDSWILKYSQKNNIDMPALTKALNNMKSFRVNIMKLLCLG